MASVLETPSVRQLSQLVEEAARATAATTSRFVEPTPGALQRATLKRHHLVFGRRGSGKTTLLRKAVEQLTIDRRPIAFVDLETFKGLSYPDVLLSVLIKAFSEFRVWLETAGRHPASRTTFWKRIFGKAPQRPPFDKRRTEALAAGLGACVQELDGQLHAADAAPVTTTLETAADACEKGAVSAKLGTKELGFGIEESATQHLAETLTVSESSRRSKVEFLQRHLADYQALFERIAQLSGGDAYLFLDDLYHIRRADQPELVDYFHRIAKNGLLWLKIGTIRHRTEWYKHGNPPRGMKLGDDVDEIDLDLTLDKYMLTRTFLTRVLGGLAAECGDLSLSDILADGGLERLVLASGGVVRDFLAIFRRSVDVARERAGGRGRGIKIGAEDVNNAAGEHDATKREELKRDTPEERDQLEKAFGIVSRFCLDERKVNCFLVERDQQTPQARLIDELVDLRLMHLVDRRVTVRDPSARAGSIRRICSTSASTQASANATALR